MEKLSYSETFDQHTGNSADKWEGYLYTYNDEFELVRNKCKKVLEVGVNNGGSLEVMASFFPNLEQVVGLDINSQCQKIPFSDDRIKVEITNACSPQTAKLLREKYGSFDLILDDGSHQSKEIIQTFFNLFSLLVPGGTFIIEDLCTSYWSNFGGGLYNAESAMSFLKQLPDLINKEHWVTTVTIEKYLNSLGYKNISPECLHRLSQIKSVSFYNSICVIKTTTYSWENSAGKRFCRGDVFSAGYIPVNGTDMSLDKPRE